MTEDPSDASDAARVFREDYPPSGRCFAKAPDDATPFHVWERTRIGAVVCADCSTSYPEEAACLLTESDLDFLQSVCDAQGPLYAGTHNAKTGQWDYPGMELVDDEEGEDLTFYLVARTAMPMLVSAYRELVEAPRPLQKKAIPDRLVHASGLPELSAHAALRKVLPLYRDMVIDELRVLARHLSGVERGVANAFITYLLDNLSHDPKPVQEAA